jgi:hypothetical protein
MWPLVTVFFPIIQVLTAGHSRVFETSMKSALKYLVDIDIFYVLAPKAKELEKEFGGTATTTCLS